MGADKILFDLTKLEMNWSGQTRYAQINETRCALVALSNQIYAGEITTNDIQSVLERVNELLKKYLNEEV